MTSIRTYPVATCYSAAYRAALRHATAEIDAHRHLGQWPLERLVWHARTLYRAAWAEELSRPQ